MIKVFACDKWFSDCVRIRSNFTCDNCGIIYPGLCRDLHCSHGYGRGNWSVRFDVDNAFAHCSSCHKSLGGNPIEFFLSVENLIGRGRIDIVAEKAQSIDLGRMARKGKKDGSISKHYRDEFRRIEAARFAGNMDRIEVENWA